MRRLLLRRMDSEIAKKVGVVIGIRFIDDSVIWRHIVLAKKTPEMYMSVPLQFIPEYLQRDYNQNNSYGRSAAKWDLDACMEPGYSLCLLEHLRKIKDKNPSAIVFLQIADTVVIPDHGWVLRFSTEEEHILSGTDRRPTNAECLPVCDIVECVESCRQDPALVSTTQVDSHQAALDFGGFFMVDTPGLADSDEPSHVIRGEVSRRRRKRRLYECSEEVVDSGGVTGVGEGATDADYADYHTSDEEEFINNLPGIPSDRTYIRALRSGADELALLSSEKLKGDIDEAKYYVYKCHKRGSITCRMKRGEQRRLVSAIASARVELSSTP